MTLAFLCIPLPRPYRKGLLAKRTVAPCVQHLPPFLRNLSGQYRVRNSTSLLKFWDGSQISEISVDPWSTVQIMKQLPQTIFRNMGSLKLVHNHCSFGRASAALSKAQQAHEVPFIKPSKARTSNLAQAYCNRLKHMQSHYLPGLQSRLQWYGLQHIYTVSLEDLHTGKRLSSAACLRSGHRQNWQQSKRGSSIGGWSRGKRTHADRSAPRLSIAASNISSWLSLSRFNRSFRTISVL